MDKFEEFKSIFKGEDYPIIEQILGLRDAPYVVSGSYLLNYVNGFELTDIDVFIGESFKDKFFKMSPISSLDPSKNRYVNAMQKKYNFVLDEDIELDKKYPRRFDFFHTMWSYVVKDDKFYIDSKAKDCIKFRKLILNPNTIIDKKTCSRYFRFMDRGMTPDNYTANRIQKYINDNSLKISDIKENRIESTY